jgi:hypothetical protein
MDEQTAYPLCWPPGRPATKQRIVQQRFQTTFADARDACLREIKLLGGLPREVVISTNIPLRRDGLPYSTDFNKAMPQPGVAVYFKRKGKDLCFACDCWAHVQDNMHAISLTIAALRGIARWGTGDMMEAAFTGFQALPAPGESSGDNPWRVLGVAINATEEQVKEAYRILAKKLHPDNPHTGNRENFDRLQKAYNLISQNLRRAA